MKFVYIPLLLVLSSVHAQKGGGGFMDENILFVPDTSNKIYTIETRSENILTITRYVDSLLVDIVSVENFRKHIIYENEHIYNTDFLSNESSNKLLTHYIPDFSGKRRHFFKVSSIRKGLIYGSSIIYWKNDKEDNFLLSDYSLIDETKSGHRNIKINDSISIIDSNPVVLMRIENDHPKKMFVIYFGDNSMYLDNNDTDHLISKIEKDFGSIPTNIKKRKYLRMVKMLNEEAFKVYEKYVNDVPQK